MTLVTVRLWVIFRISFAFILLAGPVSAQDEFDRAPINYKDGPLSDPVHKLAEQIRGREHTLAWDDKHGWLPSLLDALKVPRSSQTLVFSRTSQQAARISPSRPRALYFSDSVYVGWVQSGDFVEIASVDPQQGAVFYTVDQQPTKRPMIQRDRGQCLACHANGRTQKVPGFLVRSVFPKSSGQPEYRLGTETTDHRSSFDQRYGGWYVTGTHGDMRHRGNSIIHDESDGQLHRDAGANLVTLPRRVRADDYLTPHSDIVAMMVLEHQTQFHNLVTKASYTTRTAMHQQQNMNRILEREPDYVSDSTVRRINSAADKLVDYMLFKNEFRLTSPVQGTSEFAAEFAAAGVRDSKGRSLRDLDLQTRLLKYPCSHLVYSDSFRELPAAVLKRIRQRMLELLTSGEPLPDFPGLHTKTRSEVLSILRETHNLFRSTSATRAGN